MKLIIAGSRSITNYNIVIDCMNLVSQNITEIVSGTASGVDRLGERWAIENNIPIKKFPANWNLYGKSAGYKRNELMADYSDSLVAIWDGISKGTKNMIDIAKRKKLLVYLFNISIIPNSGNLYDMLKLNLVRNHNDYEKISFR